MMKSAPPPTLHHERVGCPAAEPRGTAPVRRTRPDRRAWGAFALLAGPLLIGLGLFKYVAIGWSFLLSLSEARGTIALGHWVGLDNYRTLLSDAVFRKSLGQILLFTVFIVPVTFAASLGLALLVHRIRRGRAVLRTAFLIPAAVSYVAASLLWKMSLFNGLPSGIANTVGGWFGMDAVPWLQTTSPPLYWVVLITLRLWLQVGFYMVLFLAGLQGIPKEMYEAAALDGATGLRLLRRITLPMLRNTSVAVLMLQFIAAFQAFDEFYNLFNSGLSGSAAAPIRTPLGYLYDTAMGSQNYGLGSAGAFVLTALIVGVTLIQGRLTGFGKGEE
ncbi:MULTISPECIES: sugar ABC transporter permease [unclassified Streptomyces]|jgi:multiple sugar transport system permease protein|uniref:carbohydrate ABC transporter permease n=2 Tax=Streptomyces TaxID=1883 RepID=UPI00081BC00A|nr:MULTISPECIES: sugar ABC transporter permease [unclassified Streptomyces]MEE1743799.1 sugar ABC transporter permease [Streptomyces sp. JV184]SCE45585.1 multiple sugar transport system permease protein [Streptomyces sp. DvalAA-43]